MPHCDTARFKGFSQPITQAPSPSAAAHQTLYLASPRFCCFTLQHQVQGTQSWWSGICLLICRVSARFRDSLAAAFNLSAQLKAPDGTCSRLQGLTRNSLSGSALRGYPAHPYVTPAHQRAQQKRLAMHHRKTSLSRTAAATVSTWQRLTALLARTCCPQTPPLTRDRKNLIS